ncbi:lysine N(6)-hydroxylase/L-ornithine N(5)-oxygenase family protein [Methylopila sp. Yamaguchi]|uniref:lysine N(6)-hydroxylase/L-ornithine N(5)-oxygenase family protein n=1 Tax=Methylopila sp. Yamaguchi TaxID=1437817 RepID=UPI000CC3CC31|nr:lysine N(6)-hydroxylase/L-ornithine N(5)-oxygenase family protein [Methylopila sp. Yamaguchi]GBD49882.1 L-ornithine 5-monooxygenase [Methylopila sp. Yamaguchi]
MKPQPAVPFDVLGVGFGPSNLATAIAIAENNKRLRPACSYCFIEKQEQFIWHRDMLLPDSDMQISFIKDLVTLRDPTSPFTFVNYLHEKGRLEAFINRKSFFPSRIEFNDYLRWVAVRFEDGCHYGVEALSIEPETSTDGVVRSLVVRARAEGGGEVVRRTHDLVLAVGGAPHVPPAFATLGADARVFHSSRYLRAITEPELASRAGLHVAVVGAGQSAAEIALDLHGRFADAKIDMLFRGVALKPADDTPFVNEIFNPEFTDFVFAQPEERRREIIGQFRETNYAVIDADLLGRIYEIVYQQRVRGDARLRLQGRIKIANAVASRDGVHMTILDAAGDEPVSRQYDAVVLATGYERDIRHPLLAPLAGYLEDFEVERDYRLRTRPDFRPRIHVQGLSEDTHGLSDTLLSVLAIRSQEIALSLVEAKRRRLSEAASEQESMAQAG